MVKLTKNKRAKKKPARVERKLTRKEQRKQRAVQKKESKRLFFSKKPQVKESDQKHVPVQRKPLVLAPEKVHDKTKSQKSTIKLAPESLNIEQLLSGNVLPDDEDESIASDFSDEEVDARLKGAMNKQQQSQQQRVPKLSKTQQTRPDAAEQHRRELQRQKDLEQAARKQRKKALRLQNEDEDKEIARLEKKLKLNRTKDKNRLVRKMFNDGLDYALDLCLDDEEERAKLELKERRKKEQQRGDDEDDKPLSEADVDRSDGSELEDEATNDNHDSGSDLDSTEGSDGDSDAQIDEAMDGDYKEDIYGRKRDKDGNIINDKPEIIVNNSAQPLKYIPPHLRAHLTATKSGADADGKQTQLLERLRKQCKGLLNRLSEANLHKIAAGIEELYMRNSRHNMNETLTALLNEALIGGTMTKDRMVQEHMVLLAYLHAHIGSEIGAHFLQCYIEKFANFVREDVESLAIEDKRLNNVILLLSYMYIFKIYEHRLLVEIIEKLAQNLCEKTIECMLLIFQSVGFKLRKDDPVAFKQMTNSVQQRIAAAPLEMKENLRLKFMVDTLNAVKHNNINKIPQFDPELAENLRKRLKGMLRHDKYVTTLNITMEDLLRVDQVGKWWVVGSAWSGNISDMAAAQKQTDGESNSEGNRQRFSDRLMTLARQQQMNTEERRNIFCIIMSAEDFVDAFEKILHLALKDQRSIAYVIIHCSLNEARPNPYYAHLALKFCNYNRKFQLAFQFAAWDRINDIESLNRQQIRNLGQFLQQLILNAGLQLSVLKVVDFVQLHKSSFLLMKEIIVGLLLHTNEREIYQSFEQVAKNPKVQQFKNSLRLFMQHFLLKQEASKLKLDEEKSALLAKRIDHVDKLLSYVDL